MLTFIWTPLPKVRRECRSPSCVNSSWCFTRVGNLSSVCWTILMVNSVKVYETLPCSYLRMYPYDTLQQRMTSETLCNWAYSSLPQINIKLYLPCVKRLQRNYQRSHRTDGKDVVFLSLDIFSFEVTCAGYNFLWSFQWEMWFNFCSIQGIKAVKTGHFFKCQIPPLAPSLLKSSILGCFVAFGVTGNVFCYRCTRRPLNILFP